MSVILQSKTQETFKSVREKIFSESAKFTLRVQKFRSACGYHKIRPQILPKGLNTYKSSKFMDGTINMSVDQCFVQAPDFDFRPRTCSVDLRHKTDVNNVPEDSDYDRQYHSLPCLYQEGTTQPQPRTISREPEEPSFLTLPENVQIKTPSKKRRNSKPNTKIFITNDNQSNPTVLPAVLLTYNKDHMQLGESNPKIFNPKPVNQKCSNSTESSEV